MSTLSENLPLVAAVALFRKHLGMEADYSRWPACYQSLAEEIDELVGEVVRLREVASLIDCYLKAPEGTEEVASYYDQLCRLRAINNIFPKTLYGYPKDWPACPSCGAPALDGKATCGRTECGTIADNQ